MNLTPQQQKIVNYLSDGKWKCFAGTDFFMKDDRKRISELNELGFNIIGMKCDKSCGKNHSSRVYMRKMKSIAPVPQVMYVKHPLTGERITTTEYAKL